MFTIFNNREIAIFTWVVVFLVFCIFKKDLRSSIVSLLKSMFNYKIVAMFLLMIMYMELVLFILIQLCLWDSTLLKSTIYWIFMVGVFLIGNQIKKDRKRYSTIILDSLKLTVVGQFIVGMYCFSLLTEFILVPVLVFVGMIWAVSESDEKYKSLYKCINMLVIIYGSIVFFYSVYHISIDTNPFFTFSNLKSFILPFILLLCYFPFLYIIALYVQYETMFVRFKYNLADNKQLYSFLKRRILVHCNFNIIKLKLVSSELRVYFLKDEDDVRRALHEIIREGKQEIDF